MKKLFVLFVTIALVIAMSVPAFADPGAFVQSPSSNGAPTINEDVTDDNIKVTAYRNRDTELNEAQIDDFEKSYNTIVAVDDLTSLIPDLSAIADGVNVKSEALAVSDLFYVSLENNGEHVDGTTYKVSLYAETLENFVCLLKFVDGKWAVVANVELKGTELVEFTADDLGSYAVVVSTGSAPEYPEPPTPDNNNGAWVAVGIVGAVLATAAAGSVIVVVIYKSKHKKDDEE